MRRLQRGLGAFAGENDIHSAIAIQIAGALEQIAQQNNMTEGQFLTMLRNRGVIPTTLIDQIRAQTQRLMEQRDRSNAWAETALALDQEFHLLISRCSGSERLAEEIGRYRNLVVAAHNGHDPLGRVRAFVDPAEHEGLEHVLRLDLEELADLFEVRRGGRYGPAPAAIGRLDAGRSELGCRDQHQVLAETLAMRGEHPVAHPGEGRGLFAVELVVAGAGGSGRRRRGALT